MLTSTKAIIIVFLKYCVKNRLSKKIHNQHERLSYKDSKFPGNIDYRQGNFFEIRQYYDVFMNLKLYRKEG